MQGAFHLCLPGYRGRGRQAPEWRKETGTIEKETTKRLRKIIRRSGYSWSCRWFYGKEPELANIYGYVRVSTKDQNEDRQIIAMHEYGIYDGNNTIDAYLAKIQDTGHEKYVIHIEK